MKKALLFFTLALTLCLIYPNTISFVSADSVPEIVSENLNISLESGQDLSMNSSTIYITDYTSDGGKIYRFDLGTYSILDSSQLKDTYGDLTEPNAISVNYSGTVSIGAMNVNDVHIRSTADFYTDNIYSRYFTTPTSLVVAGNIGTILDITNTINGDIYLLDNANKIYKKSSTTSKFVLYCNLSLLSSPITVNSDSKIAVSLDDSILLLSVGNVIYSISENTASVQTIYNLPNTLYDIQSIILDHKNDLYVLTKGTENQLVHATETENTTIILDSTFTDTINFCINADSGVAYFLYPTLVKQVQITNSGENFFNSLQEENSPIDVNTFTPTTPLNVVSVINDNTNFYKYANYLMLLNTLDSGKLLVVLDDSDDEFYYVMDTNISQYNVFGFIKKSNVSIENATTAQPASRLIINSSTVYVLPSTLSNDENGMVRTVDTLSQYTSNSNYFIVTPVDSATLPVDFNGVNFVPITYTLNDTIKFGYIDARTIIETSITPLPNTFVTNATTREEVEIFANRNLDNAIYTLSRGVRVNVVNTANDVCLIEWQEDGITLSGYVSHIYIDDGKFSNMQILGLVMMTVALVCVVLMLIAIHIRKKKARIENADFE